MSRKEKKSFDIIVYAMMILAVIYAIVQSVLGNNQELHFKLTLGIWILAAVVISDFVEPMVNREFDAMNEQELKKFLPYAITICITVCEFCQISVIRFFFSTHVLPFRCSQ